MIKINELISSPKHFPISFVYNGKKINGIPENWGTKINKQRIDANITITDYEGIDPDTKLCLRVECIEYSDYPVAEWTGWFENRGDMPTPLISDILALDSDFAGESPVLTYCNGDTSAADQYTQKEILLTEDAVNFAPEDGRATDNAFPYFRLKFNGGGLTVAVGWPGQWSAGFCAFENTVHIKAGQEKTNLRLLPGEKIRTPRITLLAWNDDEIKGINLWRGWYRSHILQKTMRPNIAVSCNGGGYEFVEATQENQLRFIDIATKRNLGVNVWWIDAGWYDCIGKWNLLPVWWTEETKAQGIEKDYDKHWWFTGTWEPDTKRFPNGLKPVSDRAAEKDMDLLLWFESERVFSGSRIDREHPEWLLKIKSAPKESQSSYRLENNHLLNLGNPECCQWLTNHISKLITKNGIKIYRQDFNFPPLQYWRENEDSERQGTSENFYVQGLLKFWDGLLVCHPDLRIDTCAAGGRRNDLETMRRAVPLICSDFGMANNIIKVNAHNTLANWLPYFMGINACDETGIVVMPDRYTLHCSIAPMIHLAIDILNDNYDYGSLRKMLDIWSKAAELILNGDYYPHTSADLASAGFVVRQYDDPSKNAGFIQCITHTEYRGEKIILQPCAISDGEIYIFCNPETGATIEKSGAEINNHGLEIVLSARDACIWFYEMYLTVLA
jgi:alpha-galactosidase